VVVGVFAGRPVYLRDVAEIRRWPEEPDPVRLLRPRRGHLAGSAGNEQPAVTLSIAKRPGANAIAVAQDVLRKVETLQGRMIPAEVEVTVTRHYGETAAENPTNCCSTWASPWSAFPC
jgi:multidrug efflux pump subunit AcrB